MLRTMLTGKIHRATVTHADLHYVGSITIDSLLLDAAGIAPAEQVCVVNINTGARLETYTIEGEPGSGVIGINGAAARLVAPGDHIIVMAYGLCTAEEIAGHLPRIVHVNDRNQIVELGDDPAHAAVDNLRRPPHAITVN